MRRFLAGLSFFCGALIALLRLQQGADASSDGLIVAFAVILLSIVIPIYLVLTSR